MRRHWAAGLLGCWAAGLLIAACGPSEQQPRALWLFYDTASVTSHTVAAEILRAGGRVRYASRWLHAVSAELPPNLARRITGVMHVQPLAKLYAAVAIRPSAHSPIRPAQQDSASYGPNFRALRELGVPQAHALGFTARGIRIAIIDTGFNTGHEAFTGLRIIAQRDFINRDANVNNEPGDPVTARDQEIHGTWVWSILGATRSGRMIGPAFQADYILAKVDVEQVGEADFAADEDRWVAAVEWADSVGARVINSSLTYRDFVDKPSYTFAQLNGDVAISSVVADAAARRGVLIVTAMGNLGPAPGSIMAPADADSVIAVGAVDSLGAVAPMSSRGPTGDGRRKPELAARGVSVTAANSRAANAYEVVSFGTSLAAPFITGAAAMFVQAWPNLTAMAVRNALILSGTHAAFPDNERGAGVPNVASAILFPEGIRPAGVADVDINNSLRTIAPTFSWSVPLVHPSARPVYRLELATDPAFNTIIYSDTVSNALSLMVKRPIQPIPAIWWRVTAEAFPGIRRSTQVSGPLSMPDWVTLTVLNDVRGSIVNTTRPTFRWEPLAAPPPAGPLVYDLQILSSTGQVVQNIRNLTTASTTAPEPLTPNLRYRWRVIARSQLGVADTVESRGVFLVTSSTRPPATLLYPPFPNPFPRGDLGASDTRFWFDISEDDSRVDLAILDLRGRLIKQLIPAQPVCGQVMLDPGQFGRAAIEADPCQLTRWDGTDLRGQRVSRGVYVARLRVNGKVFTQRILYLPQR